jgi:hypothetical protein
MGEEHECNEQKMYAWLYLQYYGPNPVNDEFKETICKLIIFLLKRKW